MLNWIEPRPKRHLNRRTLSKFKIENSKKKTDKLKNVSDILESHVDTLVTND